MRAKTKAWIDFAKQDLAAAQKLADDEYFSNIAAYHAQQCIEKSLKAILEENSAKIPRSHASLPLLPLITPIIPSFSSGATDEELARIDDIYTDVRYPGSRGMLPNGQPTCAQAKEFIDIAQRVLAAVHAALT